MKRNPKEIDLKLKERAHEIIEGPRLPAESELVTLIKYIRELENVISADEKEFEKIEKDCVMKLNGAIMLALVSTSTCTGDRICNLCSSNVTKRYCRYCSQHNLFEYYKLSDQGENKTT